MPELATTQLMFLPLPSVQTLMAAPVMIIYRLLQYLAVVLEVNLVAIASMWQVPSAQL